MSGTKSSAPNAVSDAEALSLTVHSMPTPDMAAQNRRRSGRLRMLLVLVACAAPVVASYFTYYVVRPDGRSNYSELIEPARDIPADLNLRTPAGEAITPSSLSGQWLLVVVGSADCDQACEDRIYLQRQLREMLGKERDRLDRVWLITGDGSPRAPLLEAAQVTGELTTLHVDRTALARWLTPQAGQQLEDHVYIVDPMGKWMMRAPVAPEPAKLKRDLDRLLRASAFWDRAGR